MPTDLKGIPISPLTGVMDFRSAPDQLGPGSLRLRQNLQTTAQNKIRRGHGWPKLLTSASYNNEDHHDQLLTFIPDGIRQPPTLLLEAQSTGGARSLILGSQTSISKLNEWSGNWRVLGSGYGGTPSASAAAPRFKAAQVGDYLALTNDFNKPMYHILESSPITPEPLIQTFDELDTIGISQAAVIWAWHNCLFFADVVEDGLRKGYKLIWSGFNNPTSFDPANLESITGEKELFTHERILAGAEFGSSFLIYTTHGIWEMIVVGGEQTFNFARRFNGEEAKGTSVLKYPNTLVVTPQAHVYAAEDGIYEFNPYYGAPRRPEWAHRATGSSGSNMLAIYKNIDSANCQVHVATFHKNEYLISTAPIGAPNNCPTRTLRLNSSYDVADVLDFGFSAFAGYRSYKVPTLRDFMIANGICTLEALIAAGYPFTDEGLPNPLPSSSAAFTPTHFYTSTAKVVGTAEVPGTTKNVVSYARTSGVATFVVTAHGLATNDRVLITGVPDRTFNGVFTVTVVNANTFTVISLGPNLTTTVPAAVVRKIRKPHAAIAIVEVDGTVTVKMTAHGLANGDLLRVTPTFQGNPTLRGNLAVVTVLDANTFTYPAAALANDTRFGMPNVKNEVGGQVYAPNTGVSGVVTTFAGTAGASGSTDATGAAARFNLPFGTCVDLNGNIYVADTANHTIRKITPAGVVTTLAGTAGASGTTDDTGALARFNQPRGIAVGIDGTVYVADTTNHTIRQVTAGGVVTTIAGTAGASGNVDDTGALARFSLPGGIAVDSDGTLYIADTNNNSVRKIVATVVTTLATASGGFNFNGPAGICVAADGTIYLADTGNHTIHAITPMGVVTKIAGQHATSGHVNGTGTSATFNNPGGIAAGTGNYLYVADTFNFTIRRVTTAGVVTTEAGLALTTGSVDGTGTVARFNTPEGISTDAAGNQYVADTNNHTIRKVASGASQFQVTTLIPGRIYHYVPGANDASLTLQGTSTVITVDTYFTYDGLGALLLGPTSTTEKPVTAVISGGVPIVVKTIGPVLTPTAVSRTDADNPDVATFTLASHGLALGDRLWIYGLSDQSLDFYDIAVSRISDDVDITATTFGIIAPGVVISAGTPVSATMAKLMTQNVVTEDWTVATADSASLCALLSGARLDDYCKKCEGTSLLVGAASDDWSLKQIGDVFYRERCANPMAVGTSGANGYASAVGSYLLAGYDSILRFAPMYVQDDREALVVLETILLYYFSRTDTKATLRVGIGAQPVDPNSDRCDLRWFQHSAQDLKCLSAQTIAEMDVKGTIPDKNTKWRFVRRGKVICVELKISGTGGDVDLSSVVAELKREGTARF